MTIEKAPQPETPEFPKLTGPLGEFVDSITDDIPYEHRALTALTYMGLALSGRAKFSGEDYAELQPRFYACLIGTAGTGKSAAMKEVKRALNGEPKHYGVSSYHVEQLGKVHVQESINSGPALVMALKRNPRLLYMPDEGSGAFEKFKSGRGLSDILRLLEDNEIGHAVRDKETTVHNAHFAMVLSATPTSFAEMWTGTKGAGSGLQSRFVLSYSQTKMPPVPKGTIRNIAELAAQKLKEILEKMPDDIWGNPGAPYIVELPDRRGDFTSGLTEGFDNESVSAARAVDMGRRFALIMAVCNGKSKIDDETIQLGREFIKYQLAMFDRFMPDDASNPVQRFENRILRYFERHPGLHKERDVRNNIRPENSPGGLDAFRRAFNNLTANEAGDSGKYSRPGNSGELVSPERIGYTGALLWKLNPDRNVRNPKPTVEEPWKPEPFVAPTRDPGPTLPTAVVATEKAPAPIPVPIPPTVVQEVKLPEINPELVQRTPIESVVEIRPQETRDPGPTLPTPSVIDPNEKPSTIQFKGYTARCTKLVREVLPKAGNHAPGLLLPYLKRTFGVQEIQNAPMQLWETTLMELENADSPEVLLSILTKSTNQNDAEEAEINSLADDPDGLRPLEPDLNEIQ